MRRFDLLMLGLFAASALGGCRSAPATILLRIEPAPGLASPEELHLLVLGPAGWEVKDQRIPAQGKPVLPGEVVLYPPRLVPLRLLGRALVGGSLIGEGAVLAQPLGGQQVRVTMLISSGQLPDADGDGIPDAVDSCPSIPNPDQVQQCQPDGGVDVTSFEGPPPLSDGRGDLACDKDKDGYASVACGGLDCDDSNPNVRPGAAEGPPGSPSCSDGLDNDCDGATDGADTGCRNCTNSADCDDGNTCTKHHCQNNVCQNSPLPNGTPCDDGRYCTTPDGCLSGLCGSKPRVCPALPCKTSPTCNEAADRCDYTNLPDGQSCEDGDPCTQAETCAGGICKAPLPQIETIEPASLAYGTDHVLRLDGNGRLHVAYAVVASGFSPAALRYATNVSGSWKVETIDKGEVAWPALALDGTGQVHVVYATSSTIVHAIRPSTGVWQKTPIDSGLGSGHASLAKDSSGTIHLVYTHAGKLRYRSWTGSAWSASLNIDDLTATGVLVGWHASLAVDGGGKIHVAHGAGTAWNAVKALRYTSNAGGSWASSDPAAATVTAEHGGFTSLALSSSGDVFITHSSASSNTATSGTLYLTSRVAGLWKTDVVGASGTFSSLVINSKSMPLVAFRDPTTTEVHFGSRSTTGTWSFVNLETTGNNTTNWISLAQESSGRAHIFFENQLSSAAKHAVLSACP